MSYTASTVSIPIRRPPRCASIDEEEEDGETESMDEGEVERKPVAGLELRGMEARYAEAEAEDRGGWGATRRKRRS
jgi:hypothetical protein